ncbi:MAG: flagellar basal body rod protein FlgB [Pseudomonadota bacterium]
MAISFDKFLGIHDDALMIRSKRTEILASNIANADTPGYKAQDIDFQQAMKSAQSGGSDFKMQTTSDKHIQGTGFAIDGDIKYRQNNQPSVDGNTVETHTEKTAFAKNALEYSFTLEVLNKKFSGIRKALKTAG